MKFKTRRDGDCKGLTITGKFGDEIVVETEFEGTGLFIKSTGVLLSRKKALKLAHAIVAELEYVPELG